MTKGFLGLQRAISHPAARLAGAAVLLLCTASAASWPDRKEYDLVLNIRAEAAPQKRLKLLDDWKAKYPQSELRQVRRELYLLTYHAMANPTDMLRVAEEMMGEQSDNFVGLYWCAVLIPASKDPTPDRLRIGETAAQQLLANLDKYFAVSKKPAGMVEADWVKEKAGVDRIAHRALGWVEWQRGNYANAEKEFAYCLLKNSKDAEMASWYGSVLALQKQPEKQTAALWQMARAVSLQDEGALPDIQKKQMSTLLEKLYTSYHGDLEGYDKMLNNSLSAPNPPADFTVESAGQVAARKAEAELEHTNPTLAAWKRLRTRLEGPDGEQYFNESVKGAPLAKLKGTLVRCEPANRPKMLVVAISDTTSEEVTVRLDAAFTHGADAGTPIEFEGTPEVFSRSPFGMIVSAEKEKVEGWPTKATRK